MPRTVMELEHDGVYICLMDGIIALDRTGYNVTFRAQEEQGLGWYDVLPAAALPRDTLQEGVRLFNDCVRDVLFARVTRESLIEELEARR